MSSLGIASSDIWGDQWDCDHALVGVQKGAVKVVDRIRLQGPAMSRTLPAAASAAANNDRYRIVSNPAPAKVSANNTTIADTAAERAEMPKLEGHTERMKPLRGNDQTADTPTV
jgi:hypothetical protein